MSLDLTLFFLRMLSGILLISLLLALFIALWREYRFALSQAQVNRRSYGQLIAMLQVEQMITPTGVTHSLRPITSIGRSPTNTIIIDDTYTSNEHALISLREGRWWLEDRNSRNGTMLNGEIISSAIILADGDMITIGNTVLQLSINQ